MRRILFPVLAIFLISISTVACGPEGGEVGNDDNQNNDNSESGYDDAQAMGENLGRFVEVMVAANEYECECTSEDDEEEAECLEEGATASDRDHTVSCITDVINDYDTDPPQLAVEFFECVGQVMQDVLDCFDDAYAEHDDMCTLDGAGAFEDCGNLIDEGGPACESTMEENDDDGAAEEWSEGIEASIEEAGCMDIFNGETGDAD